MSKSCFLGSCFFFGGGERGPAWPSTTRTQILQTSLSFVGTPSPFKEHRRHNGIHGNAIDTEDRGTKYH